MKAAKPSEPSSSSAAPELEATGEVVKEGVTELGPVTVALPDDEVELKVEVSEDEDEDEEEVDDSDSLELVLIKRGSAIHRGPLDALTQLSSWSSWE